MLKNIYDEENENRIVYVWRCACRETGVFWHQIIILNKDLTPVSAQVVFSNDDNRFTVLNDAQAILIARQMLLN